MCVCVVLYIFVINNVMHGNEKPWNLKMHFPGLKKVMGFRKNGPDNGKVMEF